jgi:hypothetical protein
MTALSADRKTDQQGTPDVVLPQLLNFPVEAATTIYGGALVATNAAGNAVPASASTALKLWGRCERQVVNTTAAGYGAAGALTVQVHAGVFYFSNSTSDIDATSVGKACYAVDDNNVSLSDNGGTRPYAGIIYPNAAPLFTGQVAVGVGFVSPYSTSDQQGTPVIRVTTAIPLATIQAQTSGTAFNVGSVLPVNSRVLATEINVTTAVSGGSLSAVTAKLQGGSDTAGSLLGGSGGTSVFTGANAIIAGGGSNPYASRGAQQIKMTLTSTSDTLANATAGVLSVDIFYAIVA